MLSQGALLSPTSRVELHTWRKIKPRGPNNFKPWELLNSPDISFFPPPHHFSLPPARPPHYCHSASVLATVVFLDLCPFSQLETSSLLYIRVNGKLMQVFAGGGQGRGSDAFCCCQYFFSFSPFLPRTLHQHIKEPCLHFTVLAELSGTIPHVQNCISLSRVLLYNTKFPKYNLNLSLLSHNNTLSCRSPSTGNDWAGENNFPTFFRFSLHSKNRRNTSNRRVVKRQSLEVTY